MTIWFAFYGCSLMLLIDSFAGPLEGKFSDNWVLDAILCGLVITLLTLIWPSFLFGSFS